MPDPCLPIYVHTPGNFFPFPLISQLSIDWSLALDATKTQVLTSPDRTIITTLSGGGEGTVTIDCDPYRTFLSGVENVTAGNFIVTRRLTANPAHVEAAKNFRLWCAKSPIGGSYAIDTRVEINYDDPAETDTDTTTTDTDDAVVLPIVMKIGLTECRVEQLAIGSNSQDLAIYGLSEDQDPPWTFDRADLFTPQTFTATTSAADFGYDSGTGWELSITITASPWV